MVGGRVAGLFRAAPEMEERRAGARAGGGAVPAVSLYRVPGGGVSTVGSDHELAGLLATRHLIARGHRVIATITGRRKRRVTQARLRGYRRALQEAGLPFYAQLA